VQAIVDGAALPAELTARARTRTRSRHKGVLR
jgi:hypothetical protein